MTKSAYQGWLQLVTPQLTFTLASLLSSQVSAFLFYVFIRQYKKRESWF